MQIKQPVFQASNRITEVRANETEQECLLALRKGMIKADDRAIDWNNPSGDRVPFFHYLVERDYITAVNYLLAKPENSRKYVNLAANGKTALDIVVSHKMETLLRSRGGLYYEELRAQTANTDAKTVSAKIFMDDPVKVKPAQMQPIKGEKDYDEILQSMKSMKNIDYNQIDENGISVLEKIINSENTKALELVRNFEFEYLRELDYAYENIQNDTFKRKVKNLNVKFPHVFEALKNQSPDALDAAFEELNSPFCRKEKLVKEMIDFAYSNCRGSFLANVLFRKLQDENLLPKEAYDRMIAEREDRYNRWR